MRLTNALAAAGLAAALAAPAAAQPTLKPGEQIFGNWLYTCADGPCQAVLSLKDNSSGDRLLSWTFLYDASADKTSMIVTLPLGVALPPGVRIDLDADTRIDAPFQLCDTQGCRAVALVDAAMMSDLQAAPNASVKYIPYGAQGATAAPVPMLGFKDAYAMLKAEARKAAAKKP